MTSKSFSQQEALTILQTLIRIRTALPSGDELDCAKYIQSLFDGLAECRLLEHGHNRASLKVTIPGAEPRNLALVGHMDTVSPHNADQWEHSPFSADFADGRVYGLGAVSMKGGLTSILLAALDFARAKKRPPMNLHCCFSADEEINGIGAGALLRSGLMDDMDEIIIAEPTSMKVGLAEKGAVWLRVSVTGKRGHSARPNLSVNALDGFLLLAERIRAEVERGPSHKLLGRGTCTITTLNSGDAPNMVPGSATGTLDVRLLPTTNHYALLETIKALPAEIEEQIPGLSVSIDPFNFQAAVGMNRNAPMVKAIRSIYKSENLPYEEVGIHTFTDASRLIPSLGVPFVIMGPGDHELAFRPDENISLRSVLEMAEIYKKYIEEFSSH